MIIRTQQQSPQPLPQALAVLQQKHIPEDTTDCDWKMMMIRRKDSGASTETATSFSSSSSSSPQQKVTNVSIKNNAARTTMTSNSTTSGSTSSTTCTMAQQLVLLPERLGRVLPPAVAGTMVGFLVAVFATYFPFWIDITTNRHASTVVYQHAGYTYDASLSHFDNTFWTFGTDYGLAMAMVWSAYAVKQYHNKNKKKQKELRFLNNNNSSSFSFSLSSQQQQQRQRALLQQHVFYSRAMLLTYMLSVLAGGLAHQFFTTLESRNTNAFYVLWTVCVGSVTAASGFMGSIGSVWARYDEQAVHVMIPPQEQHEQHYSWRRRTSRSHVMVWLLSEPFWMSYAVVVTCVVVAGGWSYQRPAADIFVAGITQFPSTFYIMYLLIRGLPTLGSLTKMGRWAGLVAFIANAPLLPAYPLLCVFCTTTTKTTTELLLLQERQFANYYLSLGHVNMILHSNLLLAWCGQGQVLRAVSAAWETSLTAPPPAVPVLQNKPKQQVLQQQVPAAAPANDVCHKNKETNKSY